jgi:S1-C subfamily serine protease
MEPAGPAAKAGVLIGDILIALGERASADTDDVQAALEAHGVGKNVEATVLRGGASRKIAVTIGERPGRS